MASCFGLPSRPSNVEEDSIIIFSTSSDSNEESACSSLSSSSHRHSPPPQPQPHHHEATQSDYKLSVKNLSFSILQHNSTFSTREPKKLDILKSVSFDAFSSEILGIVGPSGTGKSTFLRIISGRVQESDFNPRSVWLNDRAVSSPAHLKMVCGYVAQEDDLLPLLTVKETLMFRAHFRLREMDSKARENKVEGLMQELGLHHVGNSFVGDEENRGISGGERKRVSIAVEIIQDPAILLLDEPTSGLDSSSALQVIELLYSMARSKQKNIVLSIHQPSYRIINYISRFLILSHGSVVHNGTLEFLEERIAQLDYQIPWQLNALEFAMEIITRLEETYHTDCITSHQQEEGFSNLIHRGENDATHKVCCRSSEIRFLCWRFWKVIYRTKQLFLARTMQAVVGGFGLGSVYMKVSKDQAGVAERLGFFAFSLSFLLSSTVEALPIYLQERRVIMKESSRGDYKVSSYMIANTLVFLPFLLVVALLFSIPVYWIVGLNPSIYAFGFFVLVVWFIVLMASSLVLFLSAVSPDFISGNSLICTVLGAFFLFSGYFIPKEIIPKYWLFMYYVSPYRYPLDSLLVNEYWSMQGDCFSWEDRYHSRCLMTGGDVLKGRGLEKDTRWMNVGIMLGFFLFYRVVSCVILARRASKTTL